MEDQGNENKDKGIDEIEPLCIVDAPALPPVPKTGLGVKKLPPPPPPTRKRKQENPTKNTPTTKRSRKGDENDKSEAANDDDDDGESDSDSDSDNDDSEDEDFEDVDDDEDEDDDEEADSGDSDSDSDGLEPEEKDVRKRKARPGRRVLQEMRKVIKNMGTELKRKPFTRVTRSILNEQWEDIWKKLPGSGKFYDMKIKRDGCIEALQCAAQQFCDDLFFVAAKLAEARKREGIKSRDLHLAIKLTTRQTPDLYDKFMETRKEWGIVDKKGF
jgi:histone H3/H4